MRPFGGSPVPHPRREKGGDNAIQTSRDIEAAFLRHPRGGGGGGRQLGRVTGERRRVEGGGEGAEGGGEKLGRAREGVVISTPLFTSNSPLGCTDGAKDVYRLHNCGF